MVTGSDFQDKYLAQLPYMIFYIPYPLEKQAPPFSVMDIAIIGEGAYLWDIFAGKIFRL